MTNRTCSVEGCDSRHNARGYCAKHYWRLVNLGSVDDPTTASRPVDDRFWAKVNKTDGCWEWTAWKNPSGYGNFKVNGKWHMAHRVSWSIEHGPITPKDILDHICRNRACVRPSHLRIATHAENMQNQSVVRSTTISGYRGVYYLKRSGKYRGGVKLNGVSHYVGEFATAEEAQEAVRLKRLELHTHVNPRDRVPLTATK